ncbi:peroxidase-related enzyme [Marinobacterium sp. AK62]|uniref:Peroxidase-related enzyme n=1 Tax=Marinobacterium alkalitolerans TaxID=1542925 RepID=A0ABS3ZDB3_9GAMM|nr:peroxidase-related enzyme [Marinobacterium alkalitolerans]MBP0049687.1 peroxidase-related enzyme [Marinobacterium alkalitolerans]
MSQPDHITALELPVPERHQLPDDVQKYFGKCDEKLGMVPNVLTAYSHNLAQFEVFTRFYNELMFGESELSPLEREMIAVVVSSENHCYYCMTAHGAAVREYSGDPALGELMVMNYRVAELDQRQRAMLDFAWKLTTTPAEITEDDRQALRDAGFSERGIWDIANIAGFYNMTNRVASAVDMQPNPEYHARFR